MSEDLSGGRMKGSWGSVVLAEGTSLADLAEDSLCEFAVLKVEGRVEYGYVCPKALTVGRDCRSPGKCDIYAIIDRIENE